MVPSIFSTATSSPVVGGVQPKDLRAMTVFNRGLPCDFVRDGAETFRAHMKTVRKRDSKDSERSVCEILGTTLDELESCVEGKYGQVKPKLAKQWLDFKQKKDIMKSYVDYARRAEKDLAKADSMFRRPPKAGSAPSTSQ